MIPGGALAQFPLAALFVVAAWQCGTLPHQARFTVAPWSARI